MMIDEAIAREREVAEMHRNDIVPKENYHNMPWIDKENELNMRSAEEHEQLAEWLEELKFIRQWKSDVMDEFCKYDCNSVEEALHYGYNKAIDDFAEKLKSECREHYIDCDPYFGGITDSILYEDDIEEIAEQLKAGGK